MAQPVHKAAGRKVRKELLESEDRRGTGATGPRGPKGPTGAPGGVLSFAANLQPDNRTLPGNSGRAETRRETRHREQIAKTWVPMVWAKLPVDGHQVEWSGFALDGEVK